MAACPPLPSDLILEILTRTSLETLDTCKCVCKAWKQMIDAPDFMSKYNERTKNVSGFFVLSLNDELEIMSKFVCGPDQSVAEGSPVGYLPLPHGIRILASCNRAGILCCLWGHAFLYSYYVCKPTTNQWQVLPDPGLYELDGIGMAVLGSSPLRFKIVILCDITTAKWEKDYVLYQCNELDSLSWTWQTALTIRLPSSVHIPQFSPCIYVHNSLHWLSKDSTIIAYNVRTPSLRIFSLPGIMASSNPRHRKCLIEYNGKLGINYFTGEGKIEHWVMEDRQRNYWRKVKEIDIEHLSRDDWSLNMSSGFYNDDIMFLSADEEVMFYNIQDGTSKTITLEGNVKSVLQAFPFRSDWKQI